MMLFGSRLVALICFYNLYKFGCIACDLLYVFYLL